jgi:hypothetical protein
MLTIVFLFALGVALFVISYLPFELVKIKIDTFSSSGNATLFTESTFKQIVVKLRIITGALLLFAVVLYRIRQNVQQYISDMVSSCLSFSKELMHYFNEAGIREDTMHLCALFMILLLAIVVRLFFLFQPMRYDEAATFTHYASKPLYFGLSNYSFPNNHLFHTFLVHMSSMFLGNQPWVIRLPAFFAGVLLVPASYVTTRIFYNKYAALLTAGFVTSSSPLIEYSTNARGYIMICLQFLLILSLARYLMESENSFAWLLFAILSALGFFTIPIMLYPCGIVVLWLFLSILSGGKKLNRSLLLKRLFGSLLMTILLTFVFYVPVFITSGLESVIGNKFVATQSWSFFVTQFSFSLHSVWDQWNRDVPLGLRILFIIGFFISLAFHKRLTIHRVPLILPTLIWLAAVLAVQRVIPYSRVWLFLLPLYIGVSSSGVRYIFEAIELKMKSHTSVVFVIVSLALSLFLSMNAIRIKSILYSQETGTFRDAEEITIFLKGYLKGGDRVLTAGPSDAPLEYYFNLYGIPVKLLYSNLDSSNRFLAIVNESGNQTLAGLLKEAGLSINGLSVPIIIKRYGSASLYEIKRDSSNLS